MLLVGLLRWWCCGGGRWRCRGSRTATPNSGAAVSSGGERESFCLPFSSSFSFFSLCFVYQRSSPCPLGFVLFLFLNFPPGFKLPLNLSFLSLFRSSLFSHFFFGSSSRFVPLLLLYFRFFSAFFLLFLLFSVGVECGIYRAKGSGGVPTAALSLCVGSDANLPCHGAGLGSQRAWVCRAYPC